MKAFAGRTIDIADGFGRLLFGDLGEVGALGEVLPEEAVGVLVEAALIGGVRVCEVDLEAALLLDGLEARDFDAVVEC